MGPGRTHGNRCARVEGRCESETQFHMNTHIDRLRLARDSARKEWEKIGLEVRVARATLTEAQRRERVSLRAYERARLSFVEAVEGQDSAGLGHGEGGEQ